MSATASLLHPVPNIVRLCLMSLLTQLLTASGSSGRLWGIRSGRLLKNAYRGSLNVRSLLLRALFSQCVPTWSSSGRGLGGGCVTSSCGMLRPNLLCTEMKCAPLMFAQAISFK
jgi:hypothetical protein